MLYCPWVGCNNKNLNFQIKTSKGGLIQNITGCIIHKIMYFYMIWRHRDITIFYLSTRFGQQILIFRLDLVTILNLSTRLVYHFLFNRKDLVKKLCSNRSSIFANYATKNRRSCSKCLLWNWLLCRNDFSLSCEPPTFCLRNFGNIKTRDSDLNFDSNDISELEFRFKQRMKK